MKATVTKLGRPEASGIYNTHAELVHAVAGILAICPTMKQSAMAESMEVSQPTISKVVNNLKSI